MTDVSSSISTQQAEAVVLDSAARHGGLLEFAHLEGRFGRQWLRETASRLVAAGRVVALRPGAYAIADACGR